MMTNEEVACVGECVTHKSTSNTVEIRVTRENLVTLGSSTPPPFPTPHLLLNNIVNFDYHSMYSLLHPTLEDPTLCSILSCTVATEAKRVPGPLYISFHVTLKPEILFFDEEEGEIDTCAICLEEERNLCPLPNCSHVFHDDCIDKWLIWSNNCPLCRAEILDDGDYDETNS